MLSEPISALESGSDNAIVFDARRYAERKAIPDEFVRHKIRHHRRRFRPAGIKARQVIRSNRDTPFTPADDKP